MPMGGMINTGAKTIGNLIGGTKDRVEGTGSQIQGMISDGLSMLGPIAVSYTHLDVYKRQKYMYILHTFQIKQAF